MSLLLSRAPAVSRRRFRPAIDAKNLVLGLVVVAIGYLTLPPIATVIVASLQSEFLEPTSQWTLANYTKDFTNPAYLKMIVNSILYAGGTTIVATSGGAVLAWLFMRTDAPCKPFIFMAATLPFIVPGLLNTFAYIFLMSPQIGLLNHVSESLTGLRPFVIYSIPGMVFVQGIHLMPLAFAMLMGVFQSMDSTLEEAAMTAGASRLQMLRRVTLRLAMPGFVSTALLIFVETTASFEVPNLIGAPGDIYVFVSEIYRVLQGYPSDLSTAATLSTVVMLISGIGITMSNSVGRHGDRYATITGKSFRPQPIAIGVWKWAALVFVIFYFMVSVIFPFAVLLWVSLLPGYEIPSLQALAHISLNNYDKVLHYPRIVTALGNSLIVTAAAAAIVMAITTIAAYISIKTKFALKPVLDGLVFIPIAIPGTILGVSVLFWYLMAPLPFALYGTLAILVVGFVTLYLPYGMRFMTPAMIQVSREMEEVASMSGAGWTTTLLRVYRPLLMPSLVGGFFFIMILAFREIAAAVFLYAQGTELFSLALYDMWGEGLFGFVSALGVLMIILFAILLIPAHRLVGRGFGGR